MIYTSYYAKLNKIPKNIIPIGISLKIPNWYKGYTCKSFAPTPQILYDWKKFNNKEKYILEYNKILKNLDAQNFLKMIEKNFGEQDIVLLCYETPEKFCHRHLVSQWLNNNGIDCKELET